MPDESNEQQPQIADAQHPATEAAPAPAAPVRAPRVVALVGEMLFAGSAVTKVLLEDGFTVRALCPDDAAEQALRRAAPQQSKGVLHCLRGSLDSADSLRDSLAGAFGAAFLSPIALTGRTYRTTQHLDDARRFCEAIRAEPAVKRVLYHSSLSAHPVSPAPSLSHAAAAEELVNTLDAEVFRLRTSVLMGPGDRFQTEFLKSAKSGSPILGVLGYGATMLQPLHINDMALCVARIFSDDPRAMTPGVYSVAGPELTTPLDLLDLALAKVGRFKVKLHAPLFVLKLMASVAGSQQFKEKVAMLFEGSCTEQNDSTKLLGPLHRLITPQQSQEQILAAA
jgi:uncharacterized protein YbjT (DUF2867 family)